MAADSHPDSVSQGDDELPVDKEQGLQQKEQEEAQQEEDLEDEEEKASEMPAPDVVERMRAGVYMPEPEVVYNTKNVADMHYLFTNDKLKEESPAVVLRSDPFCIPRVTDNSQLIDT
eukprot:jgi/Phyca11/531921/estExt2_fgenesh1_pg.C_PHYCAscaffold_30065